MTSNEPVTGKDYPGFREAMRVVETELIAGLENEEDRVRIREIMAFRDSLTAESDRGAALMAAAYLDETLAGLLRKILVDDATVANRAFVFNGPLGTFSSRIDFGYLLGIIPANARAELHRIRKIRNSFAHVAGPVSFEDQSIRSHCSHLAFHGVNERAGPGARFRRSVMGLLGLIIFRSKDVAHLGRMDDYTIPDARGIAAFVAKVFEDQTGKAYPLQDHFDQPTKGQ